MPDRTDECLRQTEERRREEADQQGRATAEPIGQRPDAECADRRGDAGGGDDQAGEGGKSGDIRASPWM
jgi:hypothetical protein